MRLRLFRLTVPLLLACLLAGPAAGSPPGSVPLAPAPAGLPAAKTVGLTIYRPGKFIGSAIHPTIQVNGQDLVTVHNGHVFRARLLPGSYVLEADGKSRTEINARAGENYYVRLTVKPGFINGNGELTLVIPQQCENDIRELSPVDKDEVEARAFR